MEGIYIEKLSIMSYCPYKSAANADTQLRVYIKDFGLTIRNRQHTVYIAREQRI